MGHISCFITIIGQVTFMEEDDLEQYIIYICMMKLIFRRFTTYDVATF